MSTILTRRQFTSAAAAIGLGASMPAVWSMQEQISRLRRIRAVTIGAPDLAGVESLYVEWLGYSVVERGTVASKLAKSWGAPASAGRRFISMRPASGAVVDIRAVEIDEVAGYRPLTTLGWNAIELIVDDVYKLFETIRKGPYEILGEPHSLGGNIASIHAMQLIGPAREVVYLTAETGDRKASTLPEPRSFVDRPFIMVLAGMDMAALESCYTGKLNMPRGGSWSMPVWSISRAQGLPIETKFNLTLLRCAEKGNGIELDEYPPGATPRPRAEGQLPPGVAMTSFTVGRLAEVDLPFIQPPAPLYGEVRAATFTGPAGELTELIEG